MGKVQHHGRRQHQHQHVVQAAEGGMTGGGAMAKTIAAKCGNGWPPKDREVSLSSRALDATIKLREQDVAGGSG